jgi:hypothetical protein
MDQNAFITAISISVLVSLDSVVTLIAAKVAGLNVLEAGIFYGKPMKRRIGTVLWKVGFIPIGGYVKIPGMLREEDEVPQPGDFDQVSLGSRIVPLIFDKIFFALLLLVDLSMLPGGGLAEKLEGLVDFWKFVLGGSVDPGLYPMALAEAAWFPFAAATSLVFLMALLPSGSSKTSLLLYELVGAHKLKRSTALNLISMLLRLALIVFLVFRMVQYVNVIHPEGSLGVWLGLLVGSTCSMIVVAALVLALGKPVPPEKKEETEPTVAPTPDSPSPSK